MYLVGVQDTRMNIVSSVTYHLELQSLNKNNINIQCRAIRREFERVGPTLLKDFLGARWGLLPTFTVGGLLIFPSSKEKISQLGNQNANPSVRIWVPLHCHPVL